MEVVANIVNDKAVITRYKFGSKIQWPGSIICALHLYYDFRIFT